MKRILIPTDFSPCAKNALRVGAEVARSTGSEILLLHVLYSPLLEKLPAHIAEYPEIKKAVTSIETSLNKELKSPALKGITVNTKIEIGTPAPLILSIARSWKPDMIIIGSHGQEESTHPFVGSNAQKVLRGADCPVLSVKPDQSLRDSRKLIFASNFEEGTTRSFNKILEIAKALGASIQLLHINTLISFKNTATINAQIDSFEKNYPDEKFSRTLYTDYDVHSGIANYLNDHSKGIVALVTRTKSKQPSYTLGVAESVAYHSPVPVLSVISK